MERRMIMTSIEELIKLVKASGQEVIDRAEDLVGDGDLITDIDIWLRFPLSESPTIEVTRSHESRRAYDILLENQ